VRGSIARVDSMRFFTFSSEVTFAFALRHFPIFSFHREVFSNFSAIFFKLLSIKIIF